MAVKFPRYRLVSENGLVSGSKLIDLETGESVKNISRVELIGVPGDLWRLRIDLIGTAIDITDIDSKAVEYAPSRMASKLDPDSLEATAKYIREQNERTGLPNSGE